MADSINEATQGKRSRNAKRSQQTILLAARSVFAEQGLEGARLEDIAERAGVDKRLIYYYYASKEELFLCVLEEGYLELRQAERELDLESLKPMDAIRRLIEFSWRYYNEHPDFMALVNNENLHRARYLATSARLPEIRSSLVDSLGRILEQGRVDGVFRGGVDPVQLYFTLVGLTYFYLANQHTLSTIHGRDLVTPKALNERLSHVTEVILGFLVR
ncbi:TetR/AcrR family transcriptional regulator [Pseudomonas putida]|uniref:TetR/AcrR family transcriptional regulator n=1 Tax=Pseudomonas putida TaxID=303 RepID=UPI003D979721